MGKRKVRRPKAAVSEKQIERIRKEAHRQAFGNAMVLAVAAMADECGLSDEQIGRIAERMSRYAQYIDRHLIRMQEIEDIIEKETGIKFGG